MLEVLTLALFAGLLVKVISLALTMAWGIAKITASILIGLALPVLLISVVFSGGIALLVPAAKTEIVASIVKACV